MSGKSLAGLVIPMHKFVMSMTKTNGKVNDPKTYDEVVNDQTTGIDG